MATPTQKLKNIRLVIAGDIRAWMTKVTTLVSEGADIRVLDDYKGEGSIVKAYILSGIGLDALIGVTRFLFEQGVTPTPEVFVDALLNDTRVADVVMKAANGAINVNNINIYGESSHDWVLCNKLFNKNPEAIKYLISKGLHTSTKNISIDDIIRITSKIQPR